MTDLTYVPLQDVDQYITAFDPEQNQNDKAALLALWALYARAKELPTAVWDAEKEVMRYPNGRVVPESLVRRNINRVGVQVSQEMGESTRRLQAGDIGLQQWHDEGADKLRRLYWLAAVMAFGGMARGVLPQERGLVIPHIGFQLRAWENLAKEIATSPAVLKSRAFARGIMYGRGASAVYQNARRGFFERVLRYDEERRVLGIVERHCVDCPSISERGWQKAGSLPAIGDSACRSYCACHFEFRRGTNAG